MAEKREKILDSTDIISCIVLFLCVAVFLYLVFYRNADRNIIHFKSLIKEAETELSRVKKLETPQKQETKTYAPVTQPVRIDPPTFLEKINKEFIESGLELDHIENPGRDNSTYRFVAYAPFEKLLDFLFRAEQANLAIQDLDVHPYSSDKNLISITLRIIRNEMYPAEKRAFEELQEKFPEKIRDPFKKNVVIRRSSKPGRINLTWKYTLTGIGFDKARYATIDHKNYYKGDFFHGMRIMRIQSDRVYLESGSQKYFISFRYSGASGR